MCARAQTLTHTTFACSPKSKCAMTVPKEKMRLLCIICSEEMCVYRFYESCVLLLRALSSIVVGYCCYCCCCCCWCYCSLNVIISHKRTETELTIALTITRHQVTRVRESPEIKSRHFVCTKAERLCVWFYIKRSAHIAFGFYCYCCCIRCLHSTTIIHLGPKRV